MNAGNHQFPRVLVISHNVFSPSTAMGRTLKEFFVGWDNQCIAQLYFHSEVPTDIVCENYFRITDVDVVKSIFSRKPFSKKFPKTEIQLSRVNPRTDTSILSAIYQYSRKRTSLIYLLRNLIWKLGVWQSRDLEAWIENFDPQIIFFASGDYSFSYDITYKIAKNRNIPVITYCCDDYYLQKIPAYAILRKYYHALFMKSVNNLMLYTSRIITICDNMTFEYSTLFKTQIETIYTIKSDFNNINASDDEEYMHKFVYLGNLGLNRHKPLIELAHSINANQLAGNDSYIHVYSSEKRKRILKAFSKEPGIIFHGEVSKSEVDKIIQKSEYVLHVESFRKKEIEKIRYSISTKIPDLLASNSNILVYGPRYIASVDYLETHNAAVILSKDNLLADLQHYMSESEDIKQKRRINAKELVESNHDSIKNREVLLTIINASISERNI